MGQRDLIMDEIEKLGRVLGFALSKLLGSKAKGEVFQGIVETKETLKNELGINIDDILSFGLNELESYLKEKGFTDNNIEKLADYFKEIGTAEIKNKQALSFLDKAYELYQLSDKVSHTFSFERNDKRELVKQIIKQL